MTFYFIEFVGPIFLIWYLILKRFIKDRQTRVIRSLFATLVITPLIYVGLIFLWICWVEYYPKRDFNREKWISNKERRYEYSNDIIKSKMLIGKTKAEVKQLLGTPENSEERDDWYYNIGFVPEIMNIDRSALIVEFKDGQVTMVSQHRS